MAALPTAMTQVADASSSTAPEKLTPADDAAVVNIDSSSPDTTPQPTTTFWSRLVNAVNLVEEHVAEWFGLNESKYQWAIDEFMDRQMSGEHQAQSWAPEDLEAPQMQLVDQQTMQRDTDQADNL